MIGYLSVSRVYRALSSATVTSVPLTTWRWLIGCTVWSWYLLCFIFHMSVLIVIKGFSMVINHRWPMLDAWQLVLHRKLPARIVTKAVGRLTSPYLTPWKRIVFIGTFVKLFHCRIDEAVIEDVRGYTTFQEFFTRTLKNGARPINTDHSVVSPADGTVICCGRVKDGMVEQVKGVSYSLDKFFGPRAYDYRSLRGFEPGKIQPTQHGRKQRHREGQEEEDEGEEEEEEGGKELYQLVMHLSLGDYHHFHSPTEWTAKLQRHFHGELLTVTPWAVRVLPELFSLSERVVLCGQWEHGFFSMTAVGALNVGSIKMDFDNDLETNQEDGCVIMGQFSDKTLGFSSGMEDEGVGLPFTRGQHLGHFVCGSSIVLVFEAPQNFKFAVGAGDKLLYGQPLGRVTHGL